LDAEAVSGCDRAAQRVQALGDGDGGMRESDARVLVWRFPVRDVPQASGPCACFRQRVRLGSRYAVLSGVPLSVARHLRLLPLARGGGGRTDLVREHVVSPAIEGLVVRNFLTAVLA